MGIKSWGQRDAALRDLVVRTFAVRADSVDEANRSVEAIIATEQPVAVLDMRTYDVIDEVLLMSGCEPPAQAPMLADHNRWTIDAVYGSVRDFRKADGQMLARLFFADTTADGEPADDVERAWQKVKQGHLRDVSAGYRQLEYTDIEAGQSGVVLGRTYTAGQRRLRITTRWELKEVSLVPIGADQATKIRGELNQQPKEQIVNPKLRKYLVALGMRAEATDAEAQAFYLALAGAERSAADSLASPATPGATPPAIPPANPPADPPGGQRSDPPAPPAPPAPGAQLTTEQIRAQAVEAERTRVRSITELAGEDVPAELRTRAVNEGWDENRASREFLTAVRSGRAPNGAPVRGPAIHSRSHEADLNVRALSAGLLMQQGLNPTEHRFHDGRRSERHVFTEQEADQGERFARLNAIDICRECVMLDGGSYIRDYEEAIRAAVSGSSFNHIFSTNVNARLTTGWSRVQDTTIGWCEEEDVPNFMQQEDIQLQGNTTLDRLPAGGTANDAAFSDKKEVYRIARFAKKFIVDEQDFINDRLGAIMRNVDELGNGARRLRPNLVYSLMLENPTLQDTGAVFNSTAITTTGGHANLGTGVLSSASFKAAITAMVQQRVNRTATDPGEVVDGNRPRFLIVPSALEWIARELTSAAMLAKLFADSSDPFYAQLNLIAQEGIRVVIDDRISAVGVKDPNTKTVRTGLDTNWFLTSGTGLRVAYLRGRNRQPQTRSFQLDRGQWGMGWDINMDIGAAFMDYIPWYKSTGAA